MGQKHVWRSVALTALLGCLASPAAAQTAQAPPPPVPDCPDVARAIRDMMANDTRLRDWPNLTRYRWDDEGSGGFFQDRHYVNRGIGGQTTPQMLIRLRPDVLSHHPKVMVLLAGTNDIAGNTGPMSDEDVEQNIAAIAELCAANGVKVVLAGILPISDYHQKPDQVPQVIRRPMSRIAAINAWIAQYAAAHGHVFLDYAPGISDARGMLKAEFSEDDLHPNALGYAQMAPLAEAAIAKAMH